MKVIKSGPAKSWSTRTTCTGHNRGGGGCGAELQVETADLVNHSWHDLDGTLDSCVMFTCPVCQVETALDNVPSQIVTNLRRR